MTRPSRSTAALSALPALAATDEVTQRSLNSIRAYIASHSAATGSLKAGTFEIWTLGQAEKLSTMLAMHYPDPEQAAVGIWELLSNAIEHGNLEIDFDLKTKLLVEGTHSAEVERRLADPRYGARVAVVEFKRLKAGLRLKVTDEGPGFDHQRFMMRDPMDGRPNGRGIFIASRMSFSRIRYLGRGNSVEAWTKIS